MTARSIGPAVFGGTAALSQLYVFVLAPLAGAMVAALGYLALFTGSRRVDGDSSAVAAG